MTFTSPLFLFAILPAVALIYSFLNPQWRNILISLASIAFYVLGDSAAALILLILVVVNWGFGLAIGHLTAGGHKANWLAGLAIACNLAGLGYYKYAGFAIGTLNAVLTSAAITPLPVLNIVPPMGISFVAFTAISYIVDILRGDADAYRDPHHTFLFIGMFPKVIAGPITTFKSMAGQVLKREWSAHYALQGGIRFILGLAKKVIIADTIGVAVNQVFSLPGAQLTPAVAWIGAIGFTLQLYFDFSGYSDMAIGLGRVFGFRFIENFDYPYSATSVRAFWRKWHISLTNWFREYLYIPLGGNRVGSIRTYANLMIVFLLCGLWHGANWTFIIWGAWHGLFLILERLSPVNKLGTTITKITGNKYRYVVTTVKYAYTMLVIILGWVFFRSSSLGQASGFVQTMFGYGSTAALSMPGWYLTNSVIIALALGAILCWPIAPRLLAAARSVIAGIASKTTPVWADALTIAAAFIAMVLILLLSVMILATRGFQPFIYAQF